MLGCLQSPLVPFLHSFLQVPLTWEDAWQPGNPPLGQNIRIHRDTGLTEFHKVWGVAFLRAPFLRSIQRQVKINITYFVGALFSETPYSDRLMGTSETWWQKMARKTSGHVSHLPLLANVGARSISSKGGRGLSGIPTQTPVLGDLPFAVHRTLYNRFSNCCSTFPSSLCVLPANPYQPVAL